MYNQTVQAGSLSGSVATGIVNKILQAQPQLMLIGTTVPDQVQIQKLQIAQGLTPIPWVLAGAPYGGKSFLDALGAKGTQGVMFEAVTGVYPSSQALSDKVTKAGQVPNEYNQASYSEVYMIKEALEAAKSTDHQGPGTRTSTPAGTVHPVPTGGAGHKILQSWFGHWGRNRSTRAACPGGSPTLSGVVQRRYRSGRSPAG